MNEPSKSAIASILAKAGILAALICSFNSVAQGLGQGPAARAELARAQALADRSLPIDRRTHLVNERVLRPTVVQAPLGTTVVSGSTAINGGGIAVIGPGATSAQLTVKCPPGGGRVIFRDNRLINHGRIVAAGQHSTAAQVVVRCDRRIVGRIATEGNKVSNLGTIKSLD